MLGKNDLASDARFRSAQKRAENNEALIAELDAAFGAKDAEAWTRA